MKKLIRVAAILFGAAATGILVWRKVESDNLRNDLWAEAEKVEAEKTPPPRILEDGTGPPLRGPDIRKTEHGGDLAQLVER